MFEILFKSFILKNMNIVIDENISFAGEAFSQFGNVKLLQGRKITNSELKDADILIVRSITRVDKELLLNTPVQFVGTATIGTDHIDLDYLKSRKIFFTDAKGCNADAVAEYVFTSVFYLANKYGLKIKDKTIGVAGVGNIGSRIVRLAKTLGMNVLKNDPPLQRESSSNEFVSLDQIYDADIITMHVPLNKEGIDRTLHLFNNDNLRKLRNEIIFINASRGPVVDNNALLDISCSKNLKIVLDVWENEPGINIDLLEKVEFGTPHIAGYSLEGKINGTAMIYKALCKYLKAPPSWNPNLPAVEDPVIEIDPDKNFEELLHQIFYRVYNIKNDDNRMRLIKEKPVEERPAYFDMLRKNYPFRREFSNFKIKMISENEEIENILRSFRFEII